MRDILESVIFIDTIKFPPTVCLPCYLNRLLLHINLTKHIQSMPLNEFHSQLVSTALDLFPSLTEEDLKPYLLRSRATNAYDAVTLLARSVGVAFEQSQDSCTDTNLVQVALERLIMVSCVTDLVLIILVYSILWK